MVLKGGYNAWKDAGHPISYQKNGITFIQGATLFDLVDPIKLELGQVLTIEGYLHGRVDPFPYKPSMMFVGINDANQVVYRYVILKDFPNDKDPGHEAIVKVRGKIIEVRDGTGDMKVDTVEVVRGDIGDIIDIVDAHWRDFGAELLKETNSSKIDGGYSDPLFNQKTREVVVYHNVGNMQPGLWGESSYESEVDVYYFVNLDGKITKIFVHYRQVK
jgi:hypothetical protein